MNIAFPAVPASFFGMVLGLCGLGGSWRLASKAWSLMPWVGEVLMGLGFAVWIALIVLYGMKWIWRREQALEEASHPVQCCFVGLVGVSTMLVAGAATPYSHMAAWTLFTTGAAFVLGFTLWRTGILWQGGRDPASTTAVLYLPSVAGSFVTGTQAASLGYSTWGQLAFGAGLFSWLAIESVLLNRLYLSVEMPIALRPTMGIQLAPPTVGLVAYLSVTNGPPDLFAHALMGYGLLQLLLLARLGAWIRRQPFAAGYWGFSFGATAISTGPLLLVLRHDTGPAAALAPYLFVFSNFTVALLAAGTLRLLFRGRLLSPATDTKPAEWPAVPD